MSSYDELAAEAPAWFAGIQTLIRRGKNDEALRQARDQKVHCKENADKTGQLAAVRLIAKAQLAKGDAWNASKTSDEAVTLAKSIGDKKAIGGAMHVLAQAQVKETKLDAAEASAKEAEAAYKSAGFEAGLAAVMGTIASVQFARKSSENAMETAQAGIQKFKELGDFVGQAASLRLVVDMKISEDRYYHALLLAQQMAECYSQASDAEGEAAAQLLAAELQVSQGDLQSAMDRASSAAELFESVGDLRRKAAAVLVMAKAFEGAGQLEDASQAADAACGLFQESNEKRGLAGALLIAGSAFVKQDKFATAAYKFQEASFVFRQLKDRKEEGKALTLTASAQFKMFRNVVEMPITGWAEEDKENALKNATQALKVLGDAGEKVKKSKDYAQALVVRAEGFAVCKLQGQAIDIASEAESLFQDLGDAAGQCAALYVKGNALAAEKKHDEAIAALEKARALAQGGDNRLSVKDVSKKIKDVGRYQTKGDVKMSGGYLSGALVDMDVIRFEAPVYTFESFEGRAMVTGAGADSETAGTTPDPTRVIEKQRVLYNLRMQRVPNVEMNLPEGMAITS